MGIFGGNENQENDEFRLLRLKAELEELRNISSRAETIPGWIIQEQTKKVGEIAVLEHKIKEVKHDRNA